MLTISREKSNIWSGGKEESRAELSASKHSWGSVCQDSSPRSHRRGDEKGCKTNSKNNRKKTPCSMYFFYRNYILDDLKPALLKLFYCDERKDTQNNPHFV